MQGHAQHFNFKKSRPWIKNQKEVYSNAINPVLEQVRPVWLPEVLQQLAKAEIAARRWPQN